MIIENSLNIENSQVPVSDQNPYEALDRDARKRKELELFRPAIKRHITSGLAQFIPVRWEGGNVVPLNKFGAPVSGFGEEHLLSYAQVKASGQRWVYVIDPTVPEYIKDSDVEDVAAQEEPLDIWGKFDPPALPVGLLPPAIEKFARSEAQLTGGDPAGFAVSALVGISGIIPDDITLRMKRHENWYESARLWGALVGAPSTKKSPMMRKTLAPIMREDSRLAKEFTSQKKAHEGLGKEFADMLPEPMRRRLVIEDTTVEAVQNVAKENKEGLLCTRDELSGFFGGLGKYSKDGKSADRAFWLQAYNGDQYTVDRVTRGSVFIENLSLSLIGGIQPEVMQKIVAADDESGLLQRFIPIMLKPAGDDQDIPTDPKISERFETMVRKIVALRYATDKPSLLFSDDAHAVRDEFLKWVDRVSAVDSINPKLASHLMKLGAMFGRMCIVWHCVENAEVANFPQMVSGDVAKRVAAFIREFTVPHAQAFYGLAGGGDSDIEELCDHILANGLRSMTPRDVQMQCRRGRRLGADGIRKLFAKMQTIGWIIEIQEGYPQKGSTAAIINPLVHTRFAERAASERERKSAAHAAILELAA